MKVKKQEPRYKLEVRNEDKDKRRMESSNNGYGNNTFTFRLSL